MHADDNFVRSERPFEAHYFHTSGNAEMTLPAGSAEVEVMKGFEYGFERQSVTITAGQQIRSLTIRLQPLEISRRAQARSGSAATFMST